MKARFTLTARIAAKPDMPARELARALHTTPAMVYAVRSRLRAAAPAARLGGERVELRRPAMFGDDAVTAHMTRLVVELGRPRAAELLAAILADMNAIEERAR